MDIIPPPQSFPSSNIYLELLAFLGWVSYFMETQEGQVMLKLAL